MALPVEYIERLKAANPIEEVMGSYVHLKRAGRDFVCLCPFHNEKTPSCYVHGDKEYFHCFGCGAGGDVITFVMKYLNLDYWEAVKWLADRGGLPLPEDSGYDGRRANLRKRFLEMNKVAARFFYSQLKTPEGQECLKYLRIKRGLSFDTIKKYGMGFAPNSWSALKNHMMSHGYSEEELEEASLISRSRNNTKRTFDFFVNRAMFPFIDITGNIIGFGGRALSDEDKRKYLNSKDTMLYNKNKFLFSMNFAKNAASKSRQILLCEGNLDVISLNQAGFEGAVASCGTALTPEQVKIISNYADSVVICYDADEAGQKATSKAIKLFNDTGLKISVIHMTGAKDPDEYIRKFGADHFKHLINHSQGGISHELDKCKFGIDIQTPEGKTEYMRKASRVLAGIASPAQRDIYIAKFADETGISRQAVEAEISYAIRKNARHEQKRDWDRTVSFTNRPRDELNPQAAAHPKENSAERGLIYYLYNNPDKLRTVSEKISADDFVTELNRRFFKSLTRKLEENEDYSVSSFIDEFSPDEVGRLTSILEDFGKLAVDDAVAADYIKVLREQKEKSAVQTASMQDDDYRKWYENMKRSKN